MQKELQMKKLILAALVFALLLTACEPVSVPDVTDEIPDLITQEPKPEEIPEVKPPADTPSQEDDPEEEEKDILQPIVGKSYTGGPCIINNLPAFDIMVISTSSGYRLSTEVGIYDIIKGADGKYTVEGYVISVSEDGSKVTIGDAIYEGTK